jgi:hypothetical protein
MGYNTALVEWPSVQISDPVKQHLDKFFSIMDLNAPEAGDRLADEVFASDGVLVGHHPAKGTEGRHRLRTTARGLIGLYWQTQNSESAETMLGRWLRLGDTSFSRYMSTVLWLRISLSSAK